MTSRDFLIFNKINSFYPEEISFLPVKSPFVFLVTVMLSASSTDVRASAAADRLFFRFPDEKALGGADVAEIEKIIHDVGLSWNKAKNIKETAQIIAEKGLPKTMDELLELPGVGEKTASCYLSTIMGEPAVIADIHFVRVAERLGFTDTKDRTKAARQIRERFDKEYWTRISMTVNKHGRELCRPKPKCSECFLSSICPSSEVSV